MICFAKMFKVMCVFVGDVSCEACAFPRLIEYEKDAELCLESICLRIWP